MTELIPAEWIGRRVVLTRVVNGVPGRIAGTLLAIHGPDKWGQAVVLGDLPDHSTGHAVVNYAPWNIYGAVTLEAAA